MKFWLPIRASHPYAIHCLLYECYFIDKGVVFVWAGIYILGLAYSTNYNAFVIKSELKDGRVTSLTICRKQSCALCLKYFHISHWYWRVRLYFAIASSLIANWLIFILFDVKVVQGHRPIRIKAITSFRASTLLLGRFIEHLHALFTGCSHLFS
jgi:hypothetical protein